MQAQKVVFIIHPKLVMGGDVVFTTGRTVPKDGKGSGLKPAENAGTQSSFTDNQVILEIGGRSTKTFHFPKALRITMFKPVLIYSKRLLVDVT